MVEAVWHGVLWIPRLFCKWQLHLNTRHSLLVRPSYLGSKLQQRAGMLSRGRNILPPGDPRAVLITSVTKQGDNFSSISAF